MVPFLVPNLSSLQDCLDAALDGLSYCQVGQDFFAASQDSIEFVRALESSSRVSRAKPSRVNQSTNLRFNHATHAPFGDPATAPDLDGIVGGVVGGTCGKSLEQGDGPG